MSANNNAFEQEVGNGLEQDQLPAYAPMLAAYHRAAGGELQRMIADLPLRGGERVLDLACGDGVYSVWLAERVGAGGEVVGVDIAPAYLQRARQHAAASGLDARISFRQGDIARLPFPDDAFDLAWCAHSLYSLPDPVAALRELRRVVRPGGVVAILENDTLHQMLLPWPAELELALRGAQLAALEEQTRMTGKFYIGRNLCSTMLLAGLAQCCVTTYTVDRRAPLSADERVYLEAYLQDLGERARPYLDPAARAAFDLVLKPSSRLYLLDQPGFFMSQLEIVARGVKA